MRQNLVPRRSDTRTQILNILKVSGPKTVDELSRELGVSAMGVRQHLISLEGEDLIYHTTERRGFGRPSYVYALAESGNELFPRHYTRLALDLIAAVHELDGNVGVDRLFDQIVDAYLPAYQDRLVGLGLEEQIAELAQIFCEDGRMAGWTRLGDGQYLLQEHNCTLHRVARCYPQVCDSELRLLDRLLVGAEITRESHIQSGDPLCSYHIQRIE